MSSILDLLTSFWAYFSLGALSNIIEEISPITGGIAAHEQHLAARVGRPELCHRHVGGRDRSVLSWSLAGCLAPQAVAEASSAARSHAHGCPARPMALFPGRAVRVWSPFDATDRVRRGACAAR